MDVRQPLLLVFCCVGSVINLLYWVVGARGDNGGGLLLPGSS